MAVGFGYIRDEQPAIVDWSAITKEARATIKAIEADRQKKREGVDQAIRDQSEALINRPKSQNPEYNSAMSNMTTQIEATMLQNYNDLRLGNIDLNQFNATKNTMMSETKGVLAIAKTYADQYDANVEGAQNGTLSGFSNWTNAMTQEMLDFQGVETFVGPNGKISFIKKKEDGTTETLDTSELFTLANMKQQKFDMEGAIDKAKEKGGFTYINNLGQETKGYFIDPLSGKTDTDAISKAAASMVAQDTHAYGILYDYIGGYEFERLSDDFFTNNQTGEEQKAALEKLQGENDKVIYIDSNGLPMVSKTQRDAAQTYAEEQLEQVAITGRKESEFKKREQIEADIASKKSQNRLRGAQFTALMKDLGKTDEESDIIAAGMLEYTENLFANVTPNGFANSFEVIDDGLSKLGYTIDKSLTANGEEGYPPSTLVIKKIDGTSNPIKISVDPNADATSWVLDFTDRIYPILDKNELELLYGNSIARSQRGGDSFPIMEDWLADNPGKTVLDYNNAKAAFDEQNK